MHFGLFLLFWIVLAVALVLWFHVRTVHQGHGGYRRRRSRQQAVAAPNWSRSLPSRAR